MLSHFACARALLEPGTNDRLRACHVLLMVALETEFTKSGSDVTKSGWEEERQILLTFVCKNKTDSIICKRVEDILALG